MQNDDDAFNYCPSCGEKPPIGANFCDKCGKPVRHGLAENRVREDERSTDREKGSGGCVGWTMELFSWLCFWGDD